MQKGAHRARWNTRISDGTPESQISRRRNKRAERRREEEVEDQKSPDSKHAHNLQQAPATPSHRPSLQLSDHGPGLADHNLGLWQADSFHESPETLDLRPRSRASGH